MNDGNPLANETDQNQEDATGYAAKRHYIKRSLQIGRIYIRYQDRWINNGRKPERDHPYPPGIVPKNARLPKHISLLRSIPSMSPENVYKNGRYDIPFMPPTAPEKPL